MLCCAKSSFVASVSCDAFLSQELQELQELKLCFAQTSAMFCCLLSFLLVPNAGPDIYKHIDNPRSYAAAAASICIVPASVVAGAVNKRLCWLPAISLCSAKLRLRHHLYIHADSSKVAELVEAACGSYHRAEPTA